MKKNIFKNCKTVEEFFATMRADLERLRGAKFKQWHEGSYWIDARSEELVFRISASLTKGPRYSTLTWYDLAVGTSRCLENPILAIRYRYEKDQGYENMYSTSGGGGGDSYECSCRIPLKDLPLIKKLYEKRKKLMRMQQEVLDNDEELKKMGVLLQQLHSRIEERRRLVVDKFNKKNKRAWDEVNKLALAAY